MRRSLAAIYGGIAGFVVAIGLATLLVGLNGLESVHFTLLDPATGRGRADFVISTGALYLGVALLGAIGGMLLGVLGYVYGVETEPDRDRFPLRYLLPVAAAVAALFAFAGVRATVGLFGSIGEGLITISTFRMIVGLAVGGVVAGAATAPVVDALARPETLGLYGEAVPVSTRAMVREMVTAVGVPLSATIVVLAFAVGLAEILLFIEGIGAIAVFSVVAALVLAGATLLAYRPWDRGPQAS